MPDIKHLPRPDERLDLSLRGDALSRIGVTPDKLRHQIRSFLHLANARTPRKSEWGQWTRITPHMFSLGGSFRHRDVREEFIKPWRDVWAQTVTDPFDWDLATRERARLSALSLLDFVTEIEVPLLSKPNRAEAGGAHHVKADYTSTVLRALFDSIYAPVTGNNLLRRLRERTHERPGYQYKGGSGPASKLKSYNTKLRIEVKDIICRKLRNYALDPDSPVMPRDFTPTGQWVFIDLPTLASLSANVIVSNNKKFNELWSFWGLTAAFAGLPVSAISGPDGIDRVCPAKFSGSPIYSVLNALWALGCNDGFMVILALSHPNKKKRGAYIHADLYGEGNSELLQRASGLPIPNPEKVPTESPLAAYKANKALAAYNKALAAGSDSGVGEDGYDD